MKDVCNIPIKDGYFPLRLLLWRRIYAFTILGLLKGNSISSLYGSDINSESLKLAEDNIVNFS